MQMTPPAQVATWYAKGLPKPDVPSCASRTLPRGTGVRVSYAGRSVDMPVNDYGPELWTGADIDLSRGAFKALAPLSRGRIKVVVEVLCLSQLLNGRLVPGCWMSWASRTSSSRSAEATLIAAFLSLADVRSSSSSNAPAQYRHRSSCTFTPSSAGSATK